MHEESDFARNCEQKQSARWPKIEKQQQANQRTKQNEIETVWFLTDARQQLIAESIECVCHNTVPRHINSILFKFIHHDFLFGDLEIENYKSDFSNKQASSASGISLHELEHTAIGERSSVAWHTSN